MPALPPPSMQIGALAPGFSPLPPAGPVRGMQQMPALPVLTQSAGANTTSSGPTNITQNVTSTRSGTFLVWAVAVNASSGAALGGVPAGWTLLASRVVGTLALGIYVYQANPGGITSVTFSSGATATSGGIASWFWEVDNAPFAAGASGTATGGTTSVSSGAVTPGADSSLVLGIAAWVAGAVTFSDTSSGGTGWATNAQQTSTGGTTNAAIQTASTTVPFGNPAALTFQGTLSGAVVWDAAIVAIPSSGGGSPVALAPSRAHVVDGGAGYATGDAGSGGWSLGGTKPGGAGSGQ